MYVHINTTQFSLNVVRTENDTNLWVLVVVAALFLTQMSTLSYSWPWQDVYWMGDLRVYFLKALSKAAAKAVCLFQDATCEQMLLRFTARFTHCPGSRGAGAS